MTFAYVINKLVEEGYVLKDSDNRISFTIKNTSADIGNLKLPTRAYRVVNKNNIETVGELIDLVNSEKVRSLKNIGTKTIKDIRNEILEWNWSNLSSKEKAELLKECFI